MRAIPKACLKTRIRALTVEEFAELDLATAEAVGRVEPETEPESPKQDSPNEWSRRALARERARLIRIG